MKSEQAVPDQQVSTEMQVHVALRRRGIALTFTDSLFSEVHERYLQRLFQHLRNETPDRYQDHTPKVLRSDRVVFLHIIHAESC